MNKSNSRLLLLILGAGIVILLLVLGSRSGHPTQNPRMSSVETSAPSDAGESRGSKRTLPFRSAVSSSATAATAEEIVASKMKQFARSRRDITRAMAKQKNITVPAAVERFFDAVESGDWNEIETAFNAINGGDGSAGQESKRLPEVTALWGPIIDAYGAAEQVHDWPAQKLLDYGNAILGSLRPGSVYVGGTDAGRWVPTLLNDTSDGERHIVITQNGLADSTYTDYLRFLYADRFQALSNEDSQRAFNEFIDDAQKRLDHDEKFPDEPKQVRLDEQIKRDGGKTSVGGMVAVMDINERLLRILMDKNPDLPFALQESYSLKGTYDSAAPLGPIMELRASDPATFTAERAGESVAYWRDVAAQFSASPDDKSAETVVRNYAKLAVGQANLLAERGFTDAAEQTYRIALGMIPSNGEAVIGLADLLNRTGRANEGRTLMDNYARDYPKDVATLKRFRASGSITVSP
jgi:tetratricopeptide (TPR) repeat protein